MFLKKFVGLSTPSGYGPDVDTNGKPMDFEITKIQVQAFHVPHVRNSRGFVILIFLKAGICGVLRFILGQSD